MEFTRIFNELKGVLEVNAHLEPKRISTMELFVIVNS